MSADLYSTIQNIDHPTNAQYFSFQKLYEYFNAELFASKLPDVILSFSRDNEKVTATFRRSRWFCLYDNFFNPLEQKKLLHEISLNPRTLRADDQKIMCSDIVHEMCHAWQYEYGKPGRNGYHNKEWAEKMIEIGLQPYNLRKPEISTGDSVSDKIIPGGRFERAYEAIPSEFLLPFNCVETLRQKSPAAVSQETTLPQSIAQEVGRMIADNDPLFLPPKAGKVKYCCSCQGKELKNLWGKPGITGIRCEDCGEFLIEYNLVQNEEEIPESSGT